MLLATRNRAACALAALLCLASAAPACPICIAYPRESAADVLLASSCVVLAREHPQQAFSYVALEVLKGDPSSVELDLFLNSHARRLLSVDESRRCVLAVDGQTGRWRSLGVAGESYQAVVRRILLFQREWQQPGGDKRRLQFFLPLLEHDDPLVFELAYLEIARAPYGVIRRVGKVVSRKRIKRMLEDRQYVEWRPLAILLLAQSEREQDRRHLLDSLDAAQRLGLTRNLAAWATAAVELNGAEAVTYLRRHYFRRPTRSQAELAEVAKALSVHGGDGRAELRDQVVAAYADLLATHPQMAEHVVRDLTAWNRFDLAEQLTTIQQTEAADTQVAEAIANYLRLAKPNRE